MADRLCFSCGHWLSRHPDGKCIARDWEGRKCECVVTETSAKIKLG